MIERLPNKALTFFFYRLSPQIFIKITIIHALLQGKSLHYVFFKGYFQCVFFFNMKSDIHESNRIVITRCSHMNVSKDAKSRDDIITTVCQ